MRLLSKTRSHPVRNYAAYFLNGRRAFSSTPSGISGGEESRKPRPLVKSQSINSGFSLVESDPEVGVEVEDHKRRRKMSISLVGENVHASYSAKKEKDRWRKRPLFDRAGFSVSFRTGYDAAALLVQEARRRDPYQTDFLDAIQDTVSDVAPVIDKNPRLAWVFKQLMEPEFSHTFRVAWKDDNENTRINRGYLVKYSSANGPYKGGLIFSQTLSPGLVRMLGWEQTLKNALCSSFGGLKAGSDFDPEDKSDAETRRFLKSYLQMMFSIVKPEDVSLETGLKAGKKEMTFLKEAYEELKATGQIKVQERHPGYPVLFGSSSIFLESSGYACVYFAQRCAEIHLKSSLKNKVCVISGSASLSRNTARKLLDLGAKPVTFSDDNGMVIAKNGFTYEDIDVIEKFKLNNADLKDYVKTLGSSKRIEYVENGNVFQQDVVKASFVFSCLASRELNVDDAAALNRRGVEAIMECRDKSVTVNARTYFEDKEVLFAPAKALNIGSIASSQFAVNEMDAGRAFPSLQKLDENLKKVIPKIHDEITEVAAEYDEARNLKAGANILSFLRIADTKAV